VSGAPAVSGDRVVVTADGAVVAFDRTSGDEHWEKSSSPYVDSFEVGGSPVVYEDRVYVQGSQVWALAVDSGEPQWVAEVRNPHLAALSVTPNAVYAIERGSENHFVHLDPASGDQIARVELDGRRPSGPPVITPSFVLFRAQTELYLYQPKTNGVSHLASIDGRYGPQPAAFGEHIITVGDGTVTSLELSGDERWSTDIDGLSAVTRHYPVITNRGVYVFGYEGTIARLELESGNVRWKQEVEADFSDPIVAHGRVYAGNRILTGGS
jgi:outer membrane protein assembly factor BamB